jgi:CHAT domain
MLGPARSTRAMQIVSGAALVVLALVFVGLGAVEYWSGTHVARGLPQQQLVSWLSAVTVMLSGWLYIIPWIGPVRPYRWISWTTRVLVALGPGAYGTAMLYDLTHWLVVAVPIAFAASALMAWYFDRKMAEAIRSAMTNSVRDLRDRGHARRMLNDVLRIPTRKLKPDAQRLRAVNEARARIAQSVDDEAPDGLVAATDELRQVLADPPDNWQVTFQAAEDLVAAISVKANKHGDIDGYPDAIDILISLAAAPNAHAYAVVVVCYRQAEGLLTLARRSATDEQVATNLSDAIKELDDGIEFAQQVRRDMLPELHALRAECLGLQAMMLEGTARLAALDEAIAAARVGRASARRQSRRAPADLVLADLLVSRVNAVGVVDAASADAQAYADQDLAEVAGLLRTVERVGHLDQRLQVLELRAQQLSLTALRAGRWTDDAATEAWRRAAGEAARMRVDWVFRTATGWVAWAEVGAVPALCAEAYQHVMALIPRAVATRYLAIERYRLLFDVQEYAEEAGYWLSEALRVEEAAVALEMSRAVSITEILGRDRHELMTLLTAHPALLERYRRAVRGLRTAEQAAALAAETPSTLDERATAATAVLTSDLQRNWVEYDAVLREVSLVDSDGWLSGAQVSFERDVRPAATNGPLVYLAAADRSGYAIIATETSAPWCLSLPGLTRQRVAEQATRLHLEAADDSLVVPSVLRWLWDNGIRELVGLPDDRPVTLVPVGLLTLLPVHAAGGPTSVGDRPADWEFLLDRVPVRYAPNARTLRRSDAQAHAMRGWPQALLAVDAPTGDPGNELPLTRREVDEIGQRWQAAGGVVRTIHDAVRGEVWPEFGRHSVWHFACHCLAELDDIMESALILEGGHRVTLGQLLAVPDAPRRLAVLSACQSHQSSIQLPNEALGLPGGLMQIGFAGVVASHWGVPDRSATFLMARFYDHWQRDGMEPHAALTTAQRWLRRATREELECYLPGVLAPPDPDGYQARPGIRPLGHPYHWAAFAVSGA